MSRSKSGTFIENTANAKSVTTLNTLSIPAVNTSNNTDSKTNSSTPVTVSADLKTQEDSSLLLNQEIINAVRNFNFDHLQQLLTKKPNLKQIRVPPLDYSLFMLAFIQIRYRGVKLENLERMVDTLLAADLNLQFSDAGDWMFDAGPEVLRKLLPHMNPTPYWLPHLFILATYKKNGCAEVLFETYPEVIRTIPNALSEAIKCRNTAIVKLLLKENIKPSQSLLGEALTHSNAEIVELLLTEGKLSATHLDQKESFHYVLLTTYIASECHDKLGKFAALLRHGADINVKIYAEGRQQFLLELWLRDISVLERTEVEQATLAIIAANKNSIPPLAVNGKMLLHAARILATAPPPPPELKGAKTVAFAPTAKPVLVNTINDLMPCIIESDLKLFDDDRIDACAYLSQSKHNHAVALKWFKKLIPLPTPQTPQTKDSKAAATLPKILLDNLLLQMIDRMKLPPQGELFLDCVKHVLQAGANPNARYPTSSQDNYRHPLSESNGGTVLHRIAENIGKISDDNLKPLIFFLSSYRIDFDLVNEHGRTASSSVGKNNPRHQARFDKIVDSERNKQRRLTFFLTDEPPRAGKGSSLHQARNPPAPAPVMARQGKYRIS